jgi:hypothetical protein
LDVFDLFKVIEDRWSLFQAGIGIPQQVWAGRAMELRSIRHRIAHCRRAHLDDRQRIEQLLSDLEGGADQALRAYVKLYRPDADLKDDIVEDWVRMRHSAAARLIDHGRRNKGIDFSLACTRRPWAPPPEPAVTNTPGWMWVLEAHLELDRRHLFIDDYFSESGVQASLPWIGHIIQPDSTTVYVTFPAVGDAEAISDAIGRCFEAVFTASRPGSDPGVVRHPWRRKTRDLDPRVDAEGLLSVLTCLNDDDPISYFAT